jgi:hypothetical protein
VIVGVEGVGMDALEVGVCFCVSDSGALVVDVENVEDLGEGHAGCCVVL